MLPFPCSECDKKGTYNCTIPNAVASLTYTIGDAESGIIGVNFFEEDSQIDGEKSNKTMYMVDASDKFKKPKTNDKNKLIPGSTVTKLNPIKTPDDNYSIEISSLKYDNTADSADGSIEINAIIGCKKLKKKYKVKLTAAWDFEEVQD